MKYSPLSYQLRLMSTSWFSEKTEALIHVSLIYNVMHRAESEQFSSTSVQTLISIIYVCSSPYCIRERENLFMRVARLYQLLRVPQRALSHLSLAGTTYKLIIYSTLFSFKHAALVLIKVRVPWASGVLQCYEPSLAPVKYLGNYLIIFAKT